MAFYNLTDSDVAEVRLQLGRRVTNEIVSDSQVRSETILGAAADFVFQRILEDLNINVLTAEQRTVVLALREETEDSVTNFINTVLKAPQRSQLRRAIIYRAAGILVPIADAALSESAGGLAQRHAAQAWETRQSALWQLCQDEIALIQNAFPDDAFLDSDDLGKKAAAAFNMFSTTNREGRGQTDKGGSIYPGPSPGGTPTELDFDDYDEIPAALASLILTYNGTAIGKDTITDILNLFPGIIHGTPTEGDIIEWDHTNNRFQWVAKPSGGGDGLTPTQLANLIPLKRGRR